MRYKPTLCFYLTEDSIAAPTAQTDMPEIRPAGHQEGTGITIFHGGEEGERVEVLFL